MAVVATALGWFVAGRALRPLRRITAAAQPDLRHEPARAAGGRGPDDDLRELADMIDDLFARLDASFTRSASSSPTPPTSCARRSPGRGPCSKSRSATPARTPSRCAPPAPGASRRGRTGTADRGAADPGAGTARPRPPCPRSTWPPSPGTCSRRAAGVRGKRAAMARSHARARAARRRRRPTERGVGNLIDNALRHNVPAVPSGHARTDGQALLTVPTPARSRPAEVGRLLVPFERGGPRRVAAGALPATARPPDGLGLGLPIVQAIATAHGPPSSTVTARPDGGGLVCRACLPARPRSLSIPPVLVGRGRTDDERTGAGRSSPERRCATLGAWTKGRGYGTCRWGSGRRDTGGRAIRWA